MRYFSLVHKTFSILESVPGKALPSEYNIEHMNVSNKETLMKTGFKGLKLMIVYFSEDVHMHNYDV